MIKMNFQQEVESIIFVGMERKSSYHCITICRHSASLVMLNGDPWEGLFYPTLIYSPKHIAIDQTNSQKAHRGLHVGFIWLWYSVLYTVESLSLQYLDFIY